MQIVVSMLFFSLSPSNAYVYAYMVRFAALSSSFFFLSLLFHCLRTEWKKVEGHRQNTERAVRTSVTILPLYTGRVNRTLQ